MFDVGANVGNRTKILRKLGARVVAVEPQEACRAILKAHFTEGVEIVEEALGEAEGETTMYVSNADTISSLSPEWIETVKRSGRFAQYSWNERRTVKLTTLDHLIARYGLPRFMKIDVEGYELEVLKGLTQPVEALSIEFTPERAATTFACPRPDRNPGPGELQPLAQRVPCGSKSPTGSTAKGSTISSTGLAKDTETFADVYVRLG